MLGLFVFTYILSKYFIMSTFINFELSGLPRKEFFKKHIIFSVLWLLGLCFIFRLDLIIFESIESDLLNVFLPLVYIAGLFLSMRSFKWYYWLCFIIYPILLVFWFLPKLALYKGKLYLFWEYASFVVNIIKSFKSVLLHTLLFALSILLLLVTDVSLVRVFVMVFYTYLYIIFLYRFTRKTFKPRLFNDSIYNQIQEAIQEIKYDGKSIISKLTNNENYENLNEEEKRVKILDHLARLNLMFKYIENSVQSFKGNNSYIILWIIKLAWVVLITVLFFAFINYNLFLLSPENYLVDGIPTAFDFAYYTFKSITYSDIDSIKPASAFAMLIETLTFILLGLYVLVVVLSLGYSIVNSKFEENARHIVTLCENYNQLIDKYVNDTYGSPLEQAVRNDEAIHKSISDLGKQLKKLT